MKQTTEINQEVIWDNNTPKWTEKFEKVELETIEIPDYSYWNWQNTLDAPLALRNLSSWINAPTWIFTVTWLWTTTINLWFKPKCVQILSWNNVANSWPSTWWFSETNNFCISNRNGAWIFSNIKCIYVAWTGVQYWWYWTITDTWFTITIDFRGSGVPWYIWYVAFG